MKERVLNYFGGDALATEVFLSKYSYKGKETPEDMHHRMAKEFARIEQKYIAEIPLEKHDQLSEYGQQRLKDIVAEGGPYNYIYNLFKNFKYIIPQGSVMSGVGTENVVSYANCFVIPSPEDTIESIINTGRDMSQIFKRRGGVGHDLSNIRPNHSKVDNAANSATGPVSFMHFYSSLTDVIGQDGRRAALMLSIRIDHPDAVDFATIKRDLSKVNGANISFRISNDFMVAVKRDQDFILQWGNDDVPFQSELIEDGNDMDKYDYGKLYPWREGYIKRIKAKDLWDIIVESNWLSAEPGMLFWDNIIEYDPTGVYEELKPVSTNPCGELPLGDFDSCRLITANLYSLVENPFYDTALIDRDKAYSIFYEAQVLGDNLVDLEIEAIDRILSKIGPGYQPNINSEWVKQQTDEFKLWYEIRKIGAAGRRTGTGITAYGDMLAALGLPFGHKEITEWLFRIKLEAELDASIDMAIVRGGFPLWERDKEFNYVVDDNNIMRILSGKNDWYQFILDNYPEQAERMNEYSRRNAGISTIAPTGSVSILTQTTSGVEPLFEPFYTRRRKSNPDEIAEFTDDKGVGWINYRVVHPKFGEWLKTVHNIHDISTLSPKDLQEYYDNSPWKGQSSSEIDIDTRINTQARIQKYITSSISSTVNLPKDVPMEIMSEGYMKAYDTGCKGLTFYRDGSRVGILTTGDDGNDEFKKHEAPKRPKTLEAELHITRSRGNTYAVIVGLMENKPYEVFVFNTLGDTSIKAISGEVTKVKKGHYKFISEKLTIENISESGNSDLEKACALYTSMLLRHGADIHYVIKTARKIDDNISSFVSAMNRVLAKYDTKEVITECPECGGELIYQEGCLECRSCGYSKCT